MADEKATTKKKAPPKPPKIVETKRLSTSKAIGSTPCNMVVSRAFGGRKFQVNVGCNEWRLNTAELDLVIDMLTQAKEAI